MPRKIKALTETVAALPASAPVEASAPSRKPRRSASAFVASSAPIFDADDDFIPLDQMEAEDDAPELAEDDTPELLPNSVVKNAYKLKYAERAANMVRKPKDVSKKALARSASDWLAIELARRTLGAKDKIDIAAFEAILDANGVNHRHWNRTTKGWQGRLRMTGRLALQRVVAEAGFLSLPGEDALPAPKTWIAKHLS